MNARVFIALATDILGGPGKGLAQFLRSGGLEGCYPLMAAYLVKADREDSEYIRAMRTTGAPVAVLRQNRVLDPGLVDQALRLVREHGITLLQSHGYKSHVLCWLLRRKTGLPWIAFVHGWTAEDMKIRLYNTLEKTMLLLPDKVVAVSESLRRRIPAPARAKCLVIPNAVDPAELAESEPRRDIRAEFGIAPDALVVGVAGRLSPEKGQHIFLRALARARMQNTRLHGLLVGGGPEMETLQKEANALGLTAHCAFTGQVNGMGPYYRAMDIQALPSFSEGMPNAALEGMLLGKALVASRVGGVPEVVRDEKDGLLLPPGDEEALAAALLRLANDAALRERLGEAGRARALAEFTPRVRAGRILNLYTALLQDNVGRRVCNERVGSL